MGHLGHRRWKRFIIYTRHYCSYIYLLFSWNTLFSTLFLETLRSILQHRVDNSLRNDFSIGIEENLDNLFGCRMSPWEGCELRINFEINSFVIRMDLPVRNMKLGCEVRF